MDDGSVFFEVKSLRADGSRPVLSAAALEVHVRVIDHLARTTRANFVADAALDALASGRVTTMAAIELSLAGWWRRLDGGYVIVDHELIDAMSHSPRWRRFGASCPRLRKTLRKALNSLWRTLNSETVIPL